MKDALLAELRENPTDVATASALADWLQEHNDPRGSFIANQIALSRLPAGDPQIPELKASIAKSLQDHGKEWRGAFENASFENGFIAPLTLPLINGEFYNHKMRQYEHKTGLLDLKKSLPKDLIHPITIDFRNALPENFEKNARFIELRQSGVPLIFSADLTSLNGYAAELLKLRKAIGRPIKANFDGCHQIEIDKQKTVQAIYNSFQAERARQVKLYQNSPEGIAARQKGEREQRARENEARAVIAEIDTTLPAAIQSKGVALLQWLQRFADAADILGDSASTVRVSRQLQAAGYSGAPNPAEDVNTVDGIISYATRNFIAATEEGRPINVRMTNTCMNHYNRLVEEGVIQPPATVVPANGLHIEEGQQRGAATKAIQ